MAEPAPVERQLPSATSAEPALVAALEAAVSEARAQYAALRATLTRIVDR